MAAVSLNRIVRGVSSFARADRDLVSILPLWQIGMVAKAHRHHCSPPQWKAPKNFRQICDCQAHAEQQKTLTRRTLRGLRGLASQVKRHSTTLLIGLPLAVTALFPIEAMDIAENIVTRNAALEKAAAIPTLSPRARRELLEAEKHAAFSLEVARADFFTNEVPYGTIIYEEARINHLPPDLVAAVIEAESDFRPRLRSDKQALGLMQLVPETGRLMGARNLYDPHENVRAGTRYLRYLSQRYDGDLSMMLAAYNAGEGNVARFGGVPPFRETRDYVRRVGASRRHFQKRLTQHFIAASRVHSAMARE